ncbi:hypothetical protein [Promicromonospora sukumoe]|uniref:hypothetical protein n=1 Tax=Promicromonospora sukumoe TaxID=88382 RepID=UPI00037373CB|nr:hypothetical protein [Promicromonospora sukumoe]
MQIALCMVAFFGAFGLIGSAFSGHFWGWGKPAGRWLGILFNASMMVVSFERVLDEGMLVVWTALVFVGAGLGIALGVRDLKAARRSA